MARNPRTRPNHTIRPRWLTALLIAALAALTLAVPANAAGTMPTWQLPFENGQRWQAGAPHTSNGNNTGARGSLDFGPVSGASTHVVAVAAGTVYKVTCGANFYLGVDHGNGWQSTYYHMTNLQTALIGQTVQAGTYLGDAGQALPCGGSTTFNHVHLTILKDGAPTPVDGFTFGNYTVHSTGSDYYGYWTDTTGATVITNTGAAQCCLLSTTRPINPDRDGDGISDAVDLCPTTPGGGVRDGCPAVAEQWSADFNGDGSADVFFAAPDGKWYVSYSGTGNWVNINTAGVNYAQLRLADLNGDGKSDVFFAAPDGKWYVSYSGTGLWTTINSAGVPYEQLRFGDFNGDGSADVFFAAPDGKWYVSYSGTGNWVNINTAGVNYAQLRLADLNGDGKSDVFFAAPDGKWYVSYSGTGLWTTINSAGVPYEQLRFGDFNGDGSADVFFAAPDGKWYVSYSGTGNWVNINTAGVNYAQLRLADLNGDGKSDVFFAAPDGKWYVSYSGTGLWTTINSAGVPFDQLSLGGGSPRRVRVNASAPIRKDGCGSGKDSYTIPAVTGVDYLAGGTVKAPGSYPTGGVTSLTITARAKTGYVLTGTTTWTLTWTTTACTTTVTGNALSTPTWTLPKATLSWTTTGAPAGTTVTYDVQYRAVTLSSTGTRVYSTPTTWYTHTTTKTGTISGTAGGVYQIHARTTDQYGTIGAWSPWTTVTMPTDDRATSFGYTGTWTTGTSTSYYAGTYKLTSTPGAKVTVTAWTDQVALIGARTTTSGKATITIDGVLKATIDTYGPTAAYRQTLATITIPYGKHTITVTNQATTGRPRLILDALAFRR